MSVRFEEHIFMTRLNIKIILFMQEIFIRRFHLESIVEFEAKLQFNQSIYLFFLKLIF
jgi:hypothetical protein